MADGVGGGAGGHDPVSCLACVPNGCNLSPGEYVAGPVIDNTVGSCIDFDHDGIPHCVTTKRHRLAVYNEYNDFNGVCYREDCSAASGVIGDCQAYWHP